MRRTLVQFLFALAAGVFLSRCTPEARNEATRASEIRRVSPSPATTPAPAARPATSARPAAPTPARDDLTAEDLQSRISQQQARLAELQARMNELNLQERATIRSARNFQRQSKLDQMTSILGIEGEMQSTNAAMIDLQSRADPALQIPLANLALYRDVLMSQIRSSELAMRATDLRADQELATEREEIRAERESLQNDIQNVQATLSYLQSQVAGK